MVKRTVITKDWKEVQLGDVCTFVRGVSYRSSELTDEGQGIVLINLKCINKGGGFNPRGVKYFNGYFPQERTVENGDLVIANTDLTREGDIAGAPLFIENVVGKAVISMDITKIQPSKELYKNFLYFKLREANARNFMKSCSSGSIVLHLNIYQVKLFKFELPSFGEQEDIAQTLTTAQEAIAEQEKVIAKLKELKRSMMQHLFTHGTRGEKTKMTEVGEIPESWEIIAIEDLCEVKGGKRLPKGSKLTAVNTGLPYIRVTDLSDNGVDVSNIQYLTPETQKVISRYTISTKDIYISIAGSIGFVGIIPHELEGANLTENAAKLCLKNTVVQQKFLMYWLTSDQVQRNIKSQTVKNAQPKLALARIQKIPCVLPSYEEQIKISNTIDAIANNHDCACSKLLIYQNLFKTLLHELMSGEQRVKNS